MHIELKHPYLSIKKLNGFDLPDFSVLIGRNGVGKTQLLDAIAKGVVTVSDIPQSRIEKYDINSFQPRSAARVGWGNSVFAESTAEKYFARKSGPAPAKISENIFQKILETFQLKENADRRRDFEETLRSKILTIPDFNVFQTMQGNDAVSAYSQKIMRDVINPLSSRAGNNRTSSSSSRSNDAAVLLSLAMKLKSKLPHELSREDILQAAYYEGDTIANRVSQAFTRYKVEQFAWAYTQGSEGKGIIQDLMAEYLRQNLPPWLILRNSLDRMREGSDDPQLFNFEFSDPQEDNLTFTDYLQYEFQAMFRNRTTGESYQVEGLSSGEKILMSLCLASFNQTMGGRQPKLVLLDELDAVLHPSMISALIAGLKDLFVSNGTWVVMATHSVTTVSLLEEGEIFRVARNGGVVDVQPALKGEAVHELSEGLATIDSGLRIATSGGTAPITILTEGYNTLHLKKWASLFFPGKVAVFEELPDRTNKNQLLAYGRLLAKLDATSHFLLVWDCDAEKCATELSQELSGAKNVTAFSFSKRENTIASGGIENKYNEKVLEPFAIRSIECATDREIGRSFHSHSKTKFAEFILANGTTEHFQHFQDLKEEVQKILARLSKV